MLRNRYIVIDNKLDEVSARIVCAHEIGHDRFHRGLGINMFQDEMCISLKTLSVHNELAMIKAQLLNSKGYNLNVPYLPQANFLGKI